MGVAGELQVEGGGRGALVREVGLVGEEDSGAFFREIFQHPIEAVHILMNVVHAAEVQRCAVPVQGLNGVAQLSHAARDESAPDYSGVGPVIVVAENGEGPVGNAQTAERGGDPGGVAVSERSRE